MQTRMIINEDGNVGIGTTAPETKLDIAGGDILLDNSKGLWIEDSSGTNIEAFSIDSANNIVINRHALVTAPDYNTIIGGNIIAFHDGTNTERMRIDSTGKVGIGTTSPAERLEINGDAYLNTSSGDPALYIRKGDTTASMEYYGIGFTGDHLSLFQDTDKSFPWDIEALTVDDGGNVGIGTTTPSFKLDVAGAIGGSLTSSAAAGTDVHWNSSTREIYAYTSSLRFKQDISDLEIETTKIYDLRPVSFTPNGTDKREFGLIAEEVYEIIPELVSLDGEGKPLSVHYAHLSVLLLQELKKQKEKIENLELKLNEEGKVEGETGQPYIPAGFDLLSFGEIIEKVKQALGHLGILVEQGWIKLQELVVERLSAKTARIDKLEMIDQATGEVWCTWIERGEWKKQKGSCETLEVAPVINNPQPAEPQIDSSLEVQDVPAEIESSQEEQQQEQQQEEATSPEAQQEANINDESDNGTGKEPEIAPADLENPETEEVVIEEAPQESSETAEPARAEQEEAIISTETTETEVAELIETTEEPAQEEPEPEQGREENQAQNETQSEVQEQVLSTEQLNSETATTTPTE
jgi:hypothetical protein